MFQFLCHRFILSMWCVRTYRAAYINNRPVCRSLSVFELPFNRIDLRLSVYYLCDVFVHFLSFAALPCSSLAQYNLFDHWFHSHELTLSLSRADASYLIVSQVCVYYYDLNFMYIQRQTATPTTQNDTHTHIKCCDRSSRLKPISYHRLFNW